MKHCSIRLLLAKFAQDDLELQQLDVKTTFLHGDLEETIYMSQPEGFVSHRNENKVCLLKKSLYGLKQSPRQWYRIFDSFMLTIRFTRCPYDSCVYLERLGDTVITYLLLYVNDMLLASKSLTRIQVIKNKLSTAFEMKDLGEAKRILGMDIIRYKSEGKLFLTQAGYMQKVLQKFYMHQARSVTTPIGQQFKLSKDQSPTCDSDRKLMSGVPYANGVGSLMYPMVCSRPDLAYAMSVVSRFMADPGKAHWDALKWVFRYVNGTTNYGLLFEKSEKQTEPVEGFVDADFAGNIDTRKSLTGYIFNLYGTAVSWRSVLQSIYGGLIHN